MAIVYSQRVNQNIPEDQLYTRENYYTGTSYLKIKSLFNHLIGHYQGSRYFGEG
jgi:hypothetical protein